MKTIFAVDGGNSKTDAAIVRADGTVVGAVRGPGSSPHQLGVDGSLEVLQALFDELAQPPTDVAVLYLAALDFADEEEAYAEAAAARGWALETIVGNDTFAVMRAGSERSWGVAVTCGAGINCVGVGRDGRIVRFPSLGPSSGDWGGAPDVGLAAVSAAARSGDGRGPHTALERLVPEHFGVADPVELARAFQRGSVDWQRLGELAPLVFAAVEADAVAAEIVDRLAAECAALARVALTRLDLAGSEADVVLGGGLLQAGNRRLLDGIAAALADLAPRLSVLPPDSPPVVGAALAGLDRLSAAPGAYDRARSGLARATASFRIPEPAVLRPGY